jgi:hypothetical protein
MFDVHVRVRLDVVYGFCNYFPSCDIGETSYVIKDTIMYLLLSDCHYTRF